jgi:hypothetical protein
MIRWLVQSLLLLVEDANSILQLCKPHALPVDVLPPSFGVLSDFLSSHDGLLFLPQPLYFLLDPDQLTLINFGFFFFFFNSSSIWLNLASPWLTCDGGGSGLVLRCWSFLGGGHGQSKVSLVTSVMVGRI